MSVENMQRVEIGGGEAKIYHEHLSLTSGVSDTFLLPADGVYAVAVYADNGTLSFSLDAPQRIKDAASDVVFLDWDGVARISTGVTAWKFTHTSGTAVAKVTVKTRSE